MKTRFPRIVRQSFDRWVGVKERCEQSYQTHLPVLLNLAQTLKPRKIVEFGMGHYSTSVFLNRDVFPAVEQLISFEDDREWFNAMNEKHGHDARFHARLVSPPMWRTAIQLKAEEWDLIFVDDSRTEIERAKTLLALRLTRGITKRPAVVIHDVELPRIRAASLIFPHRQYASELNPQTGILCLKHPDLDRVSS